MKTGKALLGIMAGLTTGVVLGLIFAPEKGSDSRKKLSKRGEEIVEALKKSLDGKFAELTSKMASQVHTKANNGSVSLPKRETVI